MVVTDAASCCQCHEIHGLCVGHMDDLFKMAEPMVSYAGLGTDRPVCVQGNNVGLLDGGSRFPTETGTFERVFGPLKSVDRCVCDMHMCDLYKNAEQHVLRALDGLEIHLRQGRFRWTFVRQSLEMDSSTFHAHGGQNQYHTAAMRSVATIAVSFVCRCRWRLVELLQC